MSVPPILLASTLTIASAFWVRMFVVDLKRGVIRHPLNWVAPVERERQPGWFNVLSWVGYALLPVLLAMLVLLWMAAISHGLQGTPE